MWMVEASQLDHVVLIQQRAGVELEPVVEAIPGETRGAGPKRASDSGSRRLQRRLDAAVMGQPS